MSTIEGDIFYQYRPKKENAVNYEVDPRMKSSA
jgi:hypothetical protein